MQTEKEYSALREIASLRCESVGEYSLPDYNGDVRKILTVRTKVFPSGKFVGDDSLEISGTVGYEIVYLDSENNITHTEFTTDYEAAVKINSETYIDSDVRSSVLTCNVRLVGPRKLSVKCSLDNDFKISERRTYSIGGDAFMELEPETLDSSASILTASFSSADGREISAELLSIEGAIADEVEILLCDARLEQSYTDVSEGKATIKGDIVFTSLVRNAEQIPQLVIKSVPYSEELSLDDSDSFASIDCRVDFTSIKSSVTPTEDGISLSACASVIPRLTGKKNRSLELVSDAYLKERSSSNEYVDFGYIEHVASERKDDVLEYKLSPTELGLEGSAEVIYTDAHARVEKCEIQDDGVVIVGEIRVSGIACQVFEGASPLFSPIKINLPFEQNVNINCQKHGNMRSNCTVNVNAVKVNIDENGAVVNLDISSFVTISTERRQRCLGASYLGDEEYERDDSVVTVYYPDSSESLFSIAKRFHTSVVSIAESNRLTESVFASLGEPLSNQNVKKLLIK